MKQNNILRIVSFFHFVQDGYAYSIFILIPFISKEFGLSLSQAGFLKTAFSGVSSLFQVPAVLIAEKAGEALCLIGGFTLLSFGYLIMAGSASFLLLFLLTTFAGLGHSVQHPIGTSMVSKGCDPKRLGTSIGTLNLSGDVGKACVSLLAAVTVASYGWRVSLMVLGILGIAVAAASGLLRKRMFPSAGGETGPERRLTADRPGRLSSLMTPPFLLLSLMGAVDASTRMTVTTFVPFLAMHKGMVEGRVGFVLNLMFIGGIFGKFLCGYLADRFSKEKVIMLSEAVTALLIAALFCGSTMMLIPVAFLLGIFLNGSSSAFYSFVPSFLEQKAHMMGYALFYTVYLLSGAVGPSFYGILGDACGIEAIFVAGTLSSLCILPLTAFLIKVRKRIM